MRSAMLDVSGFVSDVLVARFCVNLPEVTALYAKTPPATDD